MELCMAEEYTQKSTDHKEESVRTLRATKRLQRATNPRMPEMPDAAKGVFDAEKIRAAAQAAHEFVKAKHGAKWANFAQWANRCGLAEATIRLYIGGKAGSTQAPQLDSVMLMAWGIGLTVSQFIGQSPLEPPSPEATLTEAEFEARVRQAVASDPRWQRMSDRLMAALERAESLDAEKDALAARIAELEAEIVELTRKVPKG